MYQLHVKVGRTLPAGKKVRVMTTTKSVIATFEAQNMAEMRTHRSSQGPSHTHLHNQANTDDLQLTFLVLISLTRCLFSDVRWINVENSACKLRTTNRSIHWA